MTSPQDELKLFRKTLDTLIDTTLTIDMVLAFVDRTTRMSSADLSDFRYLVDDTFARVAESPGCQLLKRRGRVSFGVGRMPADEETAWKTLLAHSVNTLHYGLAETYIKSREFSEQFEDIIEASRHLNPNSTGENPIREARLLGFMLFKLLRDVSEDREIPLVNHGNSDPDFDCINITPENVLPYCITAWERYEPHIPESDIPALSDAIDHQFFLMARMLQPQSDSSGNEGSKQVVSRASSSAKHPKPKSDSSIKAARALEALLGDDAKPILDIARSGETVDSKMRAICRIDRQFLYWKSPRWADLLGVEPSAIRQTDFWRIDRKRAIEANGIIMGESDD